MDRYIRNRYIRSLRNSLKKQRQNLRMSTDPFNISDARFIELFRFNKKSCRDLLDEVMPLMETSKYNSRIQKHLRFLVALRFFAQGSYQRSVGQDFLLNVSQSIVSRCVIEICNIFNTSLLTKYVKFPLNASELQMVKMQFYEKHGFPGIIGAIDGSHIKIKKPHSSIEHLYVCRKGGHSVNVQVVCDQNLKILDVNARFGGTAHDASVWRASALKVHLENTYDSARPSERNWYLLGDSGYPQLPFLMTPIQGQNLSAAEELYNVKHRKARNCIERCFGVLKSRFRCLSAERVLCYHPATVGKIINTCVVLHNILMDANILDNEITDIEVVEDMQVDEEISEIDVNISRGIAARHRIVEEYFSV